MLKKKTFIFVITTCTYLQILPQNTQQIFTHIYHSNRWRSKESVSGEGSELRNTEKIRSLIPNIITKYNIKTIVDAPCGDFNWMRYVNLNQIDHYLGIDIVQEIIENNSYNYSDNKIHFKCADIITDSLEKADLIICRDCLVHLDFKHAKKAIENIKKSGSKYLLTTTFPQRLINKPMRHVGLWHPYNLQIAPFNFPQPILLINEHFDSHIDRSIALWKISELP